VTSVLQDQQYMFRVRSLLVGEEVQNLYFELTELCRFVTYLWNDIRIIRLNFTSFIKLQNTRKMT